MLAHAAATLALLHTGGAIKSYDGWTAWQDVRGDDVVLKVRAPSGRITIRPERAGITDRDDPSEDFLTFDLGPDARGRPSIVLGRCAGTGRGACRLRIGRLPSRPSRAIGGTVQDDMPWAVTFWRGTLVWSDIHRTLYLRRRPGLPARVVRPWAQPHAGVEEAELHGDLLAATLNYDDQSAPEGNAVALALANVATGHRETLGTFQPGEGGQRFLGPTFLDGHTLTWLLSCVGDPSGCVSRPFGVYRRDLRTRATGFAHDRRAHQGFTAESDRTGLLGPRAATACLEAAEHGCRIRVRRLAFGPAPR